MEGAVEDAIKDENHALALRPSRYEAHATLAECYEDKNDDGRRARRVGAARSRATAEPAADGDRAASVLALPLRQAPARSTADPARRSRSSCPPCTDAPRS